MNTGWVGGSYGSGKRCDISVTRKIIDSIHDGTLVNEEYEKHEIFNLNIPKNCSGIDRNVLNPKLGWERHDEYTNELKKLATMFIDNFKKYNLDELSNFGPHM